MLNRMKRSGMKVKHLPALCKNIGQILRGAQDDNAIKHYNTKSRPHQAAFSI